MGVTGSLARAGGELELAGRLGVGITGLTYGRYRRSPRGRKLRIWGISADLAGDCQGRIGVNLGRVARVYEPGAYIK